jgi:hypothetical protein
MAASECGAACTNAVLFATEFSQVYGCMDTAESLFYLLEAMKILNTAYFITHTQAVPVS